MTSAPRGNRNPTPKASEEKPDAPLDEPAAVGSAEVPADTTASAKTASAKTASAKAASAKTAPAKTAPAKTAPTNTAKRTPRQKAVADKVAQPALPAEKSESRATDVRSSTNDATTPRSPRPRTPAAAHSTSTATKRTTARPGARSGAQGRTGVTGNAPAADVAEGNGSATTRRIVAAPAAKAKPTAAKKVPRTPRTKATKAAADAAAEGAAAESVVSESIAGEQSLAESVVVDNVIAEQAPPVIEADGTRRALDSESGTEVVAREAVNPESAVDPMFELTQPRPVVPLAPEPPTSEVVDPEPITAQHIALPLSFTSPTAPDAATSPVVLSIHDLHKRFGANIAVDGISLQVRQGSFYGIVGPNGAGKTTTLSIVTGLLRPDAGSVEVHGVDVWQHPVKAKRSMGVLPDHLRLFDRLTGAQLLFYAGTLRGLDATTVRQRSADLAAAFGLEDALGRLVADYSAGMTKKVALACAMIHSPRLLVLDEPFESVDPVSAANVIEILQRYVEGGGTVVLSSHGMDLIQRVCDSVAIIVGGLVLDAGTVDQVRGSQSLEDRFVDLAGGRKAAEGMEWLHSFSD